MIVYGKLLYVAVGGALGAVSRRLLSGAVYKVASENLPWGTAVVNILGCFLFGLVWILSDERFAIKPEIRLLLLTGFMGSFTTFSTYMFETERLVVDGQWLQAGANLLGQNLLGFLALVLGMAAGRIL